MNLDLETPPFVTLLIPSPNWWTVFWGRRKKKKVAWMWISRTLNILLVCEERLFFPSQDTSQAPILHSSVIVKTMVRITLPMAGFCANHKFCCFWSRIEVLQLLRLVLCLGSPPHLISFSNWLVIFTPGSDAPQWKSTGKLIPRWKKYGEWSDWIWSPRANEQCVQHCTHYRHTK